MSTQSPSRAEQRRAATAARNQKADRGELAVSTTSPEWEGRPHHRRLPRLTSLLLVLALVALCVILVITQVSRRLADRDILQVRQAVLTADQLDFRASTTGSVVEVKVKEGDSVTADQPLAIVEYADPPGPETDPTEVVLKAPANGIVSDVGVAAGESVIGGDDLLVMYQPDQMYFEVPMSYSDAAKLKVGMHATFDVPGLGEVKGVVTGVQSDFGDAGTDEAERLARVVVRPDDPTQVADAAPGIVTDGEIDKGSAPSGAPNAIFAER